MPRRPAPEPMPPLPASDDPDCPPRIVGGRPNRAHFAYRIAALNKAAEARALAGDAERFNPEPYIRNIFAEAELCGVTAEMIADQRTDHQIADEFERRVADRPASVLEATDREIEAMRTLMRRAVERSMDVTRSRLTEPVAKKWLSVLNRLETIRTLGREPAPRVDGFDIHHADPVELFALEASHILRYMVYTMTVGGVAEDAPPEQRLLSIPTHMAHMAVDVKIAEDRMFFDGRGRLIPNSVPVDGVMMVIPPGHGKTTFAVARARLRIAQKPYRRWLVVHAKAPEAQKIVNYVRAGFTPDEPDGRRTLALFPHLRLSPKGNGSGKITFALGANQKQTTMQAFGVHTSAAGVDADELLLDDVVDQSIAYSPTESRRVFDRINGTWMARVRRKPNNAEPPFHTIICHLYSAADPNAQWLALAIKHKAPTYYSVQPCGGPDSSPAFRALWPEAIPTHELRKIYNKMRNPALYATLYMCDPRAEMARKVAALSYFDPRSAEHEAFMARNPVFHLSIDPAATIGRQSDRSGIVYAAEGLAEHGDDDARVLRPELRVLEAREIQATQIDLVNTIADMLADPRYPVHHVHIEAAGGLWATAHMIQDRFEIEPIVHKPGIRSKESRLQSCAGYMDAGIKGISPSVRFMGLENGQPDENYRWLYDQILMFPSASDHALDAITQLVNHLAGSGHLPADGTSLQVRAAAGLEAERRRRSVFDMLRASAGQEYRGPAEVADWDYAAGLNA